MSKLPIRESSIGIGPLIKLLDRLLQTVSEEEKRYITRFTFVKLKRWIIFGTYRYVMLSRS